MIRAFFADNKNRVSLWQAPNISLLAWGASAVLGRILPDGELRRIVGYAGSAAIVVWALLEVFTGVSYFRRFLGVVVLLATLCSRLF